MPPLRRVLMNATARLYWRHVRHVTFDQICSAGYVVKKFDDDAEPLDPSKVTQRDLPEQWKIPQPVIVPKIAMLRDAVLFNDGSALLPDGKSYCHFDTVYASERWRMPPSRRVMLYADSETDGALIRRHFRCTDVPGRCFSLRNKHRGNFAHFVHDVLSRIYYEDLGAIAPGRDKVIAPKMPYPMQKALFRKIFDGYEVVQVPHDSAVKVEELLLPANLCDEERFNPLAIAALAKRMRQILAPYSEREKKKVCVSRGDTNRNTSRRNFANVEDYETRVRKLGYRTLNASEINPEEQFELWSNTSDIVGIHGSGLMNMVMMPFGSRYTEITGMRGGRLCPNSIIRCPMAAGHRVGAMACAPEAQGRLEIDLDKLEALLLDAY